MNKILVYDNGGKTIDRYTVVIDRQVYCMSDNATSPQGVNQYNCDVSEIDLAQLENDEERISVENLPSEVQLAIKDRLEEYIK